MAYMSQLCLLFLILTYTSAEHAESRTILEDTSHQSHCTNDNIALCNQFWNQTLFPNLLNHGSLAEAEMELHQFYPLIMAECSDQLLPFLCGLYAPVCTVLDAAIPPCRSVCLVAKDGCESLMNDFEFVWPSSWECELFPVGSFMCVFEIEASTTVETTEAPAPTTTTAPIQCAHSEACNVIAFSVVATEVKEDIDFRPVLISETITDISTAGHGLSNTNMSFTAPLKGLYVFMASSASDGEWATPVVVLQHNGVDIFTLGRREGGNGGKYPDGGKQVVLLLDVGDTVELLVKPWMGYYGLRLSEVSFSGFLQNALL